VLVEHEFITALEPSEVLDAVEDLAGRLGFTVEQRTEEKLAARRGKLRAARAKTIRDLPQRLQVQYERGRVTLAVALEPHGRPGDIHRDMLLTISNVFESKLARGVAADDALSQMRGVNDRIDRDARYRRIGMAIILTVLILIGAGVVALAAQSIWS
jgi:hypothetical protein